MQRQMKVDFEGRTTKVKKTMTLISRRDLLIGGAAAVAVAGLMPPAAAGQLNPASALALRNHIVVCASTTAVGKVK
jgi:hypothetical protein